MTAISIPPIAKRLLLPVARVTLAVIAGLLAVLAMFMLFRWFVHGCVSSPAGQFLHADCGGRRPSPALLLLVGTAAAVISWLATKRFEKHR